MEVILMEKVVNLGQLGDIVKVKEGYARNFLIPQGKAKRATEINKKEFEARRVELERLQTEELNVAKSRAEQLAGVKVIVSQKAGVDGRLFGSVTNHDIVDALKAQGLEASKSEIRLPNGPLKTIGDYTITVALHSDVVTDINVSVVAEQ
ncbi:MAG: 50S ribosomal protein L9 [Ferrovum sp. 37-45-19]|jgi:large subunit ribosomal protein L9|uniref:50S ribosomal protein L9 n=1 Tax=Ferrovum sp. JA12 TaxID=1356299 RepID=UPI000703660A|nr:50S ribosomal protein L9 [Ferrovum sp. JA12]OYV78887.1 MAG: 50S ribosomal protein L9 [Ferrovum sp. 21-44-67]OYV93388.1 MAG: 50S ribosomal protein L9 [Ferrovum sp. 37-45-19]OZB33412.1 MAG: 50S ribosomal protein L9 [Ferrovum sp. 34-44-207]HQT82161.1 50S ribosomal protein L9 [Ferrovaceae bacterium]KRH78818.1 50S ribosomal protein L9 [Ferrovum sp. JA12]